MPDKFKRPTITVVFESVAVCYAQTNGPNGKVNCLDKIWKYPAKPLLLEIPEKLVSYDNQVQTKYPLCSKNDIWHGTCGPFTNLCVTE